MSRLSRTCALLACFDRECKLHGWLWTIRLLCRERGTYRFEGHERRSLSRTAAITALLMGRWWGGS